MTTVCLLGTLDTKHEEYGWLRDRLREAGVTVVLVDVGGYPTDVPAEVSAEEVAAAAGADLAALRARRDRGAMVAAMAEGAAHTVRRLHARGAIDGFLALGGSSGSSIAAAALQALPLGFPKLLVSTMACGDVRPYVGETDATLMYAVVDLAGLNSVSEQVLGNAAAAMAGMAAAYRRGRAAPPRTRPAVALTMFGVTTPAADEARHTLDGLGYETLVFHATGSGGRAMERLVAAGLIAGVLDLTTTELADELVGGVLSAGPERLTAAARRGVPQVVSVGALDMVNFGPPETVPARFADRTLLRHNPTVTLMRTTAAEMAELGRLLGAKVAAATGPSAIQLPLRGVSAVDVAGGPFRDEAADAALFAAVRDATAGTAVEVHERDEAINDPGFGRAMARKLHRLITLTEEDDRA
ncbi:Tm-1-like ATP-binding domain-containing protein [Streptomyces catenulae]|uniref:Tm-1-like ATP-binding domain-containing protein n=1 Tax=Streptomyces catenulae TaxID=66875 RepID=A0ABV2YWM8_9ACTN|nr:Tm-1-like ATP-binding domain-containing protein [Streptomyces catenulae]